MHIIKSLEEYQNPRKPIILTIGNFDGLHEGHRAVLNRVKELEKAENGQSVVMTFSNHPSEILRPDKAAPLLCTLPHKVKLLEHAGVDTLLLLPFTKALSEQTAEEFLTYVRHFCPFSYLILGHDATLGKDRQGVRSKIQEFAKRYFFKVEYIDEYCYQGILVSSSKIRELIEKGDLNIAEKLLGKKYSILGTVSKGMSLGKEMGFPTANISVRGLCLPPFGVYAVKTILKGKELDGVANLGLAPTVRKDNIPILEVYLFDYHEDFYGEEIEVIFFEYLRPELCFPDISSLQVQIAQDVQQAKAIL